MRDLDRTYRLRRFKSSRDTGYAAALNNYVSTISPEIRTSSNQITYWLDRSYTEFGDEFCVCGFYVDDQIVGFAEFAFFKKEGVLFIDYLSLDPAHQSQSEYLQFTRMVREWIDLQPFEFDYAVTEIPFEGSSSQPSERTLLEVQLYKQMGFGVAHCKYRQAPLGLCSPQSDVQAFLMLSGKQPITLVKNETIVQLVQTVYLKHYLRWYSAFMDDPAQYESLLHSRIREIGAGLTPNRDVKVSGMKMLSPVVPQPIPPSTASTIVPSLLTLLCMLLFLSTLLLVHHFAATTLEITALLMGGSLIVFVAVFSLFHDTPKRTLNSILSAALKAFGKHK